MVKNVFSNVMSIIMLAALLFCGYSLYTTISANRQLGKQLEEAERKYTTVINEVKEFGNGSAEITSGLTELESGQLNAIETVREIRKLAEYIQDDYNRLSDIVNGIVN